MAVLADPENDEIERGRQHGFVRTRRRVVVRLLGSRPVDLRGRYRNPIEQGLFRHPIIAVGVIGWHTALVAEKDVDERPRNVAPERQSFVNRARCRTSSQGYAGTSVRNGRTSQQIRDFCCGSRGELTLVHDARLHGEHGYTASAPGSRGRYGARP